MGKSYMEKLVFFCYNEIFGFILILLCNLTRSMCIKASTGRGTKCELSSWASNFLEPWAYLAASPQFDHFILNFF